MSKRFFRKSIALLLAFTSVISLLAFTSGCDNTPSDKETTEVSKDSTTETTQKNTEPTKAPVQDEMTEAGKAFFDDLLVKQNNGFIELTRMLVDPQSVNASWLITPHYEDFSIAQFDAMVFPRVTEAKYSDVVNEEEFAELKGDGKTSNWWLFINGADIDDLFNQVFEKNRFTTKDLIGGNEVERITSKGYYMFQREPEDNMNYTYYVNYRYVEHSGDKVILKVNLISAIETAVTPGYVGVCEFNTRKILGRLTLDQEKNERPNHFTYEQVKAQLGFDESSLTEYTFTLINTDDGLRLHSFEF